MEQYATEMTQWSLKKVIGVPVTPQTNFSHVHFLMLAWVVRKRTEVYSPLESVRTDIKEISAKPEKMAIPE